MAQYGNHLTDLDPDLYPNNNSDQSLVSLANTDYKTIKTLTEKKTSREKGITAEIIVKKIRKGDKIV